MAQTHERTAVAAHTALNARGEDAYWREGYKNRPYVKPGSPYGQYQPAYRYGWESRGRYSERTWNQAEKDLESGWENFKGASKQTWSDAKAAVKDAWHHVEHALPGDGHESRK